MAKLLELTHILTPIGIAFLYAYFIFFLSHSITVSVVLSFFFMILFFQYAVSCYTLFHSRPGFLCYANTGGKMGVEKICEYKQNQQRKREILLNFRQNFNREKYRELQKQYARLYLEYSFCDTCELIRIPRCHHCKRCDQCVLRRQKHSQLVGSCIGQNNMKAFMQYLFIAIVVLAYMTITLLFVVGFEHDELQKFNNISLVLFATLEMTLGTCLALFIKEFLTTYINARNNLTETERNLLILNEKNNPFEKQDYYHSLFKSICDYFRIGSGPDPSYWLELHQQN